MSDPGTRSPNRLVEFLTAISRCQESGEALRTAAELVAEEFNAEVGAVVLDQTVRATVGFGQRAVPHAALADVVPGMGTLTLDGIGTCHSLAAAWNTESSGRLLVARTGFAFVGEDRNLLLGMAGALGMALGMIRVLERERGRQRVLEVLLGIQRSISLHSPLATVLAAITDGASTVLQGCPVSLVLDDALDPGCPLVVGADLTSAVSSVAAPVHIQGVPAGALVASTLDGAEIGPDERALLYSFAEHASLALTDARTVEAMQEAFRDPLTELPNRSLFIDRLSKALCQRNPECPSLAVLFIDLDRFKSVNDSLGHAAGDTLLRAVARRIRECARADVTAARFGGDEFALFLEDLDDPTFAVAVAERVIAALREPFSIQGKIVHIGATIGIAHTDAGHPDLGADELLSNADLAMYRAKAAGGGRALAYDPQMRISLLAHLGLQAQLQGALKRGEFLLHYQPIVELDTGHTVGLEALLRWRNPERGMVTPLEFIPIAETTGMIVPVGRWALGEACRQLARWRQIDPRLTMNVNVSVHQLRDPSFPADVEGALRAAGVPGEALVLEITESVFIEDQERTFDTLRTLKELGVAVALDDFGTGYSSLSYLQKLPVDILKIDRSFVSGPASDAGGDQLVRTIIELGRAYHLDVIAEGIEDEWQRERLSQLGCRRGQGFHFARPTDAARTELHLEAQRSLRRTPAVPSRGRP